MSHKVKAACGRLTYDSCAELCSRVNGSSRRIANNTWLSYYALPRNHYEVLLHGHAILEYHPGGVVVLNSCGYRTTTTKARLNQFGPVPIFQHKRDWWVGNNIHLSRRYDVPFHDGMIAFDNGGLLDVMRASTPLRPDTELGVLADWLEENNRASDAAHVRAVLMAQLEV